MQYIRHKTPTFAYGKPCLRSSASENVTALQQMLKRSEGRPMQTVRRLRRFYSISYIIEKTIAAGKDNEGTMK